MNYELGKIYMSADPNARLFYKATKVYPEIALFERVGDGTANTNRVSEFTDAVNPFLVLATVEALEKQKAIFQRDVNIHTANLAAAQDYLQEFEDAIAALPADTPPAPEPEPIPDPTNPDPEPQPEEPTEPTPEPAPEG